MHFKNNMQDLLKSLDWRGKFKGTRGFDDSKHRLLFHGRACYEMLVKAEVNMQIHIYNY